MKIVCSLQFLVKTSRFGFAGASPRNQMRLRRDRLKLTMTPRVAPAAHSGRPIMEAAEKTPVLRLNMPYVVFNFHKISTYGM